MACLLGHAMLTGQLGHQHATFMVLEDGDDLLFGMAVTLHREISCYQGKRSGNLTLTVDRFLGESSGPSLKSP
tara:strand:- start:4901 stop:5119 length:219 start_codon:yes stop_codon:yes gene_type:complete